MGLVGFLGYVAVAALYSFDLMAELGPHQNAVPIYVAAASSFCFCPPWFRRSDAVMTYPYHTLGRDGCVRCGGFIPQWNANRAARWQAVGRSSARLEWWNRMPFARGTLAGGWGRPPGTQKPSGRSG